jgi:hypothetical protein
MESCAIRHSKGCETICRERDRGFFVIQTLCGVTHMMKPQERLRTAVTKAQAIIARYIHPGKRDCEQTVNELAEVLDDEKVVRAVEESEAPVAKPISERCKTGAF